MRIRYHFILVLMNTAFVGANATIVKLADIASVPGIAVEQIAEFQDPKIAESSGLVISRQWKNMMWTHNDSGDSARIFATDLQGGLIIPEFMTPESYEGVIIGDAYNVDWEDLASDNNGNLYIAACGNNSNMRRDLAIYQIREPHPLAVVATRYFKKFQFEWPDQLTFPSEKQNFDCEALFWADGKLYALSKNRSDLFTKLYCFDNLNEQELNVPRLIDSFEIGGQVTAADTTPDGRKLAVLTYDNVWVFELPNGTSPSSAEWFHGKVKYLKTIPENIQQSEAISFLDEHTLFITNEQRGIFRLSIDSMVDVEL